MKHIIFLSFIVPVVCLAATSCRSHKESAVAQSSFVEKNSTAQVNERLTNVSESKFDSSISFDSIEIFIQRTWESPYVQTLETGEAKDSIIPQGIIPLCEVNFVKNKHPLSEIIGIRAYNAKSSASSQSQDSLNYSTDIKLQASNLKEESKEEALSYKSVRVFDPPDLMNVIIVSFIIAALIILIIYFIQRKSNP